MIRQAIRDGQVDEQDLQDFLGVTGPMSQHGSMGYLDFERFLQKLNPMAKNPFQWAPIEGFDQADSKLFPFQGPQAVWATRLINRNRLPVEEVIRIAQAGAEAPLGSDRFSIASISNVLAESGRYEEDPTLPFSLLGLLLPAASHLHKPLFDLMMSPTMYQLDHSIEQGYTEFARTFASALMGEYNLKPGEAQVISQKLIFQNKMDAEGLGGVRNLSRYLNTHPKLISPFPMLEGGHYLNWAVFGEMLLNALSAEKRKMHLIFYERSFRLLAKYDHRSSGGYFRSR